MSSGGEPILAHSFYFVGTGQRLSVTKPRALDELEQQNRDTFAGDSHNF